MSQENVEIVRSIFRGWDEAGVEGMLPFFHEDIEYLPTEEGEAIHGHDGLRRYFERWMEPWEEFHVSPTEFQDSADSVFTRARDEGARSRQRGGDDHGVLAGVALSGGPSHSLGGIPGPRRGPQGRGAVGVGDAAGERREVAYCAGVCAVNEAMRERASSALLSADVGVGVTRAGVTSLIRFVGSLARDLPRARGGAQVVRRASLSHGRDFRSRTKS